MIPLSPFRVLGAPEPISPVVISVPHAGRHYPADCAKLCRVPIDQLVRLEDRYADVLAERCIDAGFRVIIADMPRLWIDLNRHEADFEAPRGGQAQPRSISAKARGGLGLVPTRLAGVGEIWHTRPTHDDIAARVAAVHRPYHAAIAHALAQARARFGVTILIDVHSMPPLAGVDAPRIVIGDRFGRTAAMAVTDCARMVCTDAGFKVASNAPYAGEYILQRHGVPTRGIHALQIEVDRSCYLEATLRQPGAGQALLQRLLLRLVTQLELTAWPRQPQIAAE